MRMGVGERVPSTVTTNTLASGVRWWETTIKTLQSLGMLTFENTKFSEGAKALQYLVSLFRLPEFPHRGHSCLDRDSFPDTYSASQRAQSRPCCALSQDLCRPCIFPLFDGCMCWC